MKQTTNGVSGWSVVRDCTRRTPGKDNDTIDAELLADGYRAGREGMWRVT